MAQQESVQILQQRLVYEQKLVQLVDRIHAAKGIDSLFIELQGEILGLLDADRMTIYAIDPAKKELYSKFLALDTVKEIRLPVSEKSVAGYVAASGRVVNISDAYDKAELARISPTLSFDGSWDKKTGFRTQQILGMPIMHEGRPIGVIQLLNKKRGARFTKEDETGASRIAKTLGIAFNNQTQLSQSQAQLSQSQELIQSQARPKTKFDYLLAQHLISPQELSSAVAEARRRQTDVESILIEQYKVPKGDLGVSLSQFYECPFVEYDERILPPPDLVKGLRLEYLRRNFWLPLRREDGAVVVLIDNPQDLQRVDSVSQALKNRRVKWAVGLRKDILLFLNQASGEGAGRDSIGTIIGDLRAEDVADTLELGAGELDENDSAVIRLANQIIVDAYKARASDIHIEPYGAQRDTVIRYRIDGGCAEYQKIPGVYRRAIVARIKIMAQLDIAERRKPQDGKFKFKVSDREIELRVATIPTANQNEDVVMRLLSSSELLALDKIDMAPRNLREIKKIAEKPYGLILCVGPTGSGKTTTLHSLLGHINKPERKIWTAEDPVEITQYGLRQVQVMPKIGFDFAAAMRAFLRADPDVIMVGEMRDEETASTGIEASLTGHLVFSTLHTNSAVETVVRLLDMGCDSFNFADALLGIMGQRLVKRICRDCRAEYHPERAEYDELAQAFGEESFAKLNLKYDESFVLYRGKGCVSCAKTGYRGRAGIHELLIATDEMKRLIQTKARVAEMVEQAKAEGMTTLVQDGVLKSLGGLTDFRQVKAVAIK
ncbi:MAG: general secretion pathway protein GspE [Candidatus Rokuibacteriota bacterium]|nr:MAG: general secretion pathway protein GspE [Candidatus Rokubacteria bacterium]